MTLQWMRKRRCPPGLRLWQTRCGRYRVRANSLVDGVTVPVVYYAMEHGAVTLAGDLVPSDTWSIISRHKVLSAAKKACERHANAKGD